MLIYLRRVPREGGIDGVCPLKSVAAARQLSLESNPCFIGLVGVQFLGSEVIVILTLGPEVEKTIHIARTIAERASLRHHVHRHDAP